MSATTPNPAKQEEPCECEFIDVLEFGPPMRMAMPNCPQHGHPWDCPGCFYCETSEPRNAA